MGKEIVIRGLGDGELINCCVMWCLLIRFLYSRLIFGSEICDCDKFWNGGLLFFMLWKCINNDEGLEIKKSLKVVSILSYKLIFLL